MKKMTPQERLEATIAHEKVDRVCFWDMEAQGLMARYAGLKIDGVRYDVGAAVNASISYAQFTDTDMIAPCPEINSTLKDAGQVMKEPEDSTTSAMNPFFLTDEDVDSKELIDAYDSASTPLANKGIYDKIVASKAAMKDERLIVGMPSCTFTTAAKLRGTERFMMDIFSDESLVQKIIAKTADFHIGVCERCMESGADILALTDPVASEDLIDSETFHKFVYQPTKRIIQHTKSKFKKPIIMHVCGDTSNTCKFMPEMGVDIFTVDSKVDLVHYKKEVGDKMVIAGAVPTITVMLNGAKDQVMESSKACFEKAASGGGFMLFPACEVPKESPWDNVLALREAAQKYTPLY